MNHKQVEIQTQKILLVARSGFGKTWIAIENIKELVKNKKLDPRRVVIFSSTVRTNHLQIDFVQWLSKKCEKLDYPNYIEQNTAKEIKFTFIDKLYKKQEQLKEQGEYYSHWFIWIDDMQGEDGVQYSDKILKRLFLRGRHYGISIQICLQTWRSSLDTVLKDQVTDIYLGDLNSDESKIDVSRLFSSGINKNEPHKSWKTLFKFYSDIIEMNNHHQFLHIHTENNIGNNRFEIGNTNQFIDQKLLSINGDAIK